jgi:hypothetical protein
MRPAASLSLAAAALVTGCAGAPAQTVSSMHYAQAPVDPSCVLNAVLSADGFGVEGPLRREAGARAFTALFNEELPVTVIVRQTGEGAEISAFTRLAADATPLKRREAAFAVDAVDEAATSACTEAGRLSSSGDVVIEATRPEKPRN